LAITIISYLLSLRDKSLPTWLLVATFGGFAWHSLMAGLTHLLAPTSIGHFYVIHLEPLGLLVQQIALLQFVYCFPAPALAMRREAKIVLTISILLALCGIGWTAAALVLYRENGSVALVDLMTASQLLWTVVVLTRHTIRLSFKQEVDVERVTSRRQAFLAGMKRFIKPQLRQARATRAFALAYLFSILLLVLAVLADLGVIGADVSNLFVAPGILVFLFAFFIVYVNYSPQPTTFMVKLVGISLVATLSVLGITGFLVAPFYQEAYSNAAILIDEQTLHYEPDGRNGYTVQAAPFQFDANLGQNLNLGNEENASLELGFNFPFYGQPWLEAYISDNGLITFGQGYDLSSFQYRVQPAIAPFVIDFDPSAGGGIYAKSEPDKVTITWSQLPEAASGRPNTVQLVLHSDGTFDTTYNGINRQQAYSVFNPLQAVWQIGVLPGDPALPSDHILLSEQLLFSGGNGGIITDYYLIFRQFVSQRMIPLATLLIIASGLILFGFPFFFQTSLVRPLNSLVDGVREVNSGNLDIQVPVRYRDEIGFVTQSFNRMVQSVKRSDRLKDEFLANTSHELRTPLNGIIGLAESMLDGATGSLSTEQAGNLTMIVASGKRLTNLVNDILDFSRLKDQAVSLQTKPTDLYSLTQVVLTLSEALLGAKGLKLENRISPDLPPIEADENRVQQIMYNLVGNAIKFTETGSIAVSATIDRSSNFLVISVADTGIGIPTDKQARIFESFEQADGSIERQYGGTGLGLAITKQLVELHGGQIWVESTEGKGSIFTFTMPLSQRDLAQPDVTPPEQAPANELEVKPSLDWTVPTTTDSNSRTPPLRVTTGDNSEIKILIVDDEPVNLQVLKNQLSLLNYTVIASSSGMEALQIVNNGTPPDLILLDVMMPRMSGYEVCRQLREQFPLSELPILMLTAKDQVDDMVFGFQAGANDYLTKPFHKDELLIRINTLVTLKQAIKNRDALLAIQQELDIAHRIQQSLLPPARPDWAGADVVCFSSPAREVGGDLYAYQASGLKRFTVAVGDVSGKGMPAALLMAISLSSFRSIVEQGLGPGPFLAKMDRALSDYTRSRSQNCAMVYAELSRQNPNDPTFTLRTANAGCIPPLIRRSNGQVEWVDAGGMPLGVGLGAELGYREHSLALASGDLLILTSDGVVEAVNAEDEMFGFEKLEATVARTPSTSAEAALAHLRTQIDDFVQETRPHDDITIVVVKV
jgi:signal transduction histidine kinase/serine phosphatase RsbU (regulator of sigma subunit)